MKITIKHHIPENDSYQVDVFEGVDFFTILPSLRKEKDMFMDIHFKIGSKNWNKFNYHCCGVYIDPKLDTIITKE